MISKDEAKEKIKELVKRFKDGGKYWDSKPEEDIKFQFIEPLFEALGWERKDISKEIAYSVKYPFISSSIRLNCTKRVLS